MKKLSVVLSILVLGFFLVSPVFASESSPEESQGFESATQTETPMIGESSEMGGENPADVEHTLAVWQKSDSQNPFPGEESSQPSPVDNVKIDLTVDEFDKDDSQVTQ